MRFVVIGGDAAGMSAAARSRRRDREMEVVVLERTNDVSYSACGMPYNVADAGRDMNDLVVRTAKVFREKSNIDLRLGHNVESIDRRAKKVTGRTDTGEDFEVPYDRLLIATGASAVFPGIPGMDSEGALALKSLEDGRRIKDAIAGMKTPRALIVGMGYIGLEMAEAYRERGIEVTITKPNPRPLPWMPEEMAEVVTGELVDKGVQLKLGSKLERIEEVATGLKAVFDDGDTMEVGTVLVAIGVKPNSQLAEDAGLDLGPGKAIAVDKALRTSDPDIFAAGDCADAFNVVTGARVWVPLALRANRAGWAVADNVTGQNVELPGIVGTTVFKAFDLEVARAGLNVDEARKAGFDPVETIIKSRSRAHAHPGNQTIHVAMVGDKNTGKLLGAVMVGKEGVAHRIDAVVVALHAGMTVQEFSECDMAYAPPFGPVWDPLLTAGNQLMKSLG